MDETGLDELRSDSFERSYAIRWLTALISRSDSWSLLPPDGDSEQRQLIISDAAALLAICSGAAAAGTLSRKFTFERGIEVQLTDAPLESQDFSSVGAQTWGGSYILAEMLVESPERFGLPLRTNGSLRGGEGTFEFRVLELGAGTGLVSLILGKLLRAELSPGITATILATDFHPSVLANLRSNVTATFAEVSSVTVEAHMLDWQEFASSSGPKNAPFDQSFDLILGADIIYETEHALWIRTCVEKLLQKPSMHAPQTSAHGQHAFHLIIPLRPTHASESSTVEQVFPRSENVITRKQETIGRAGDKIYELALTSMELIECEANSGISGRGDDEVVYAYYTISWC